MEGEKSPGLEGALAAFFKAVDESIVEVQVDGDCRHVWGDRTGLVQVFPETRRGRFSRRQP